jgi:hypothetical protein
VLSYKTFWDRGFFGGVQWDVGMQGDGSDCPNAVMSRQGYETQVFAKYDSPSNNLRTSLNMHTEGPSYSYSLTSSSSLSSLCDDWITKDQQIVLARKQGIWRTVSTWRRINMLTEFSIIRSYSDYEYGDIWLWTIGLVTVEFFSRFQSMPLPVLGRCGTSLITWTHHGFIGTTVLEVVWSRLNTKFWFFF